MEGLELYSYEELIDFILDGLIQYDKIMLQKEFKKENSNNFVIWFINKYKDNLLLLNNLLQQAYIKLESLSVSKSIALYSEYYYEIPIYFPTFHNLLGSHIESYALRKHDKSNDIYYEIDNKPSPEYCLLMLNNLNYYKHTNNIFIFLLYKNISNQSLKKSSNINFLQYAFRNIYTLKITTKSVKTLSDFQKLTDGLLFHIMSDTNVPCQYFSNIFLLLQVNQNSINKDSDITTLSLLPQRIYKKNIIDYYSIGLCSNEPFSQYLSFYHVLEYLFDEISNVKLRKESTSLKEVLKKFIDINELQNKLSSEQIEYFQKNEISFSNAPVISFKDKQGFHTHLAQRIYQTRNSLVHSKEGNVGRYKPYQDSEELSKEIPLIKLIAELVIINSSDPL